MPLSTDHYEPSAYEKKRLERIKKNEEHMKKLGLDKYRGLMQMGSKNTTVIKKKVVIKAKITVKRRSGRLSSKSDSIVMLDLNQVDGLDKAVKQWDEDDEDDDENDGDYQNKYQSNNNSTSTATRRISINPDEYKLSDKDRIYLASAVEGNVDENYLSKFQEFLEYHDKISVQNVKNVMKQARKLASGNGIRYEVRFSA
jgi:hypothetical protein